MNTVNKLMDILPEDPTDWTNEHIEEIIVWQRKLFNSWEQKGEPTKTKAKPEEQQALIAEALKELIQKPAKVVPFKRRI